MHNLLKTDTNQSQDYTNTVQITSLELVEIINQNREEEAILTHDNFLKKVPLVLGKEVAVNFNANYKASNGKQNPCYKFPKREACLMAMSYSYELQAKVFDYMTQLESQGGKRLPQNYKEALKALIEAEEMKEALQFENEHHKSRIDRLTFVTKTYTSTELAKELGLKSATELNQKLKEFGIQYKVNRTWVLKSEYSTKGYEIIKQQELESGKIVYNRQWSQDGRDFILSLFDTKTLDLDRDYEGGELYV